MEEKERERFLEQSNLLRQELKAWEREFAAANDGRKAGREDIKQNPAIGMEIDWSREHADSRLQHKSTKNTTAAVIF